MAQRRHNALMNVFLSGWVLGSMIGCGRVAENPRATAERHIDRAQRSDRSTGKLANQAKQMATGDEAPDRSIADTWGIEIQSLRSTAADYMLDFRYRVTDAEKATPLFDRRTKPYLVDQATGAKFVVPAPGKVGPLRNSNMPKVDRTYTMFFANPGKFVKRGNKVTVVIGDFRAENIVVQ